MDFKIKIENLSPDHVFKIILKKYGLQKKDFKSRQKHVQRAKHELIIIWHNKPFNFSSVYIGALLDLDHTSILHHVNNKCKC